MWLARLGLENFRNVASAELTLPSEGVILICGANGQGKTNLLEAVALLATVESFRGAEITAMIRSGCEQGRVAGAAGQAGRSHLVDIDLELARTGRSVARRNGNVLKRNRDLIGEIAAVVFYPDDLELVKGGPGARRHFVDEGLTALSARHASLRSGFERALRQRARLLKQIGGRLDPDTALSLDIWDGRVAETGEALVAARKDLVSRLDEPVGTLYRVLSGDRAAVGLEYRCSWEGDLAGALAASRAVDVASGIAQRGPQRDELAVSLDGRPARAYASQGEQRCLALALRLGVHQVASRRGPAGTYEPPILLLDDVFSELDPKRSAALAAHLPAGQVLISAAGEVPTSLDPAAVFQVAGGIVR